MDQSSDRRVARDEREQLSDDERLLKDRIEQARQHGREERERRSAEFEDNKRQVERQRIDAEAGRIMEKLPELIRDAESRGSKCIRVCRIRNSEYQRTITDPERRLSGVAKEVYERCERLNLQPRVSEGSNASMEWPDGDSYWMIDVSWV